MRAKLSKLSNIFGVIFKVLCGLLLVLLSCKVVMAMLLPLMAAATLFNLVLWGAMGLGVLALVGFAGIKILGWSKRKK